MDRIEEPKIGQQRGASLGMLADRVRARLAAAVRAAVLQARFRGTYYCLVLSYGESLFPPTVILGREAERRAIVAARGASAKEYLYTPSEPALQIDDPLGARDYALLDEGVARQNAWEIGRRTLRLAARDLALSDWSGVLDVTDDFVVLALDYEGDERSEALVASAPPEKVALLRARGWI
jgi:hypothetical protein